METNGDVYEHLPNNNVCPTKNFTIDSVIGEVTSQPGQQDQGMDADFFYLFGDSLSDRSAIRCIDNRIGTTIIC